MGVTIMLDVSKEDVENLAQVLEYTKNEFLQNFVEKILKATDEFTKFMDGGTQLGGLGKALRGISTGRLRRKTEPLLSATTFILM